MTLYQTHLHYLTGGREQAASPSGGQVSSPASLALAQDGATPQTPSSHGDPSIELFHNRYAWCICRKFPHTNIC